MQSNYDRYRATGSRQNPVFDAIRQGNVSEVQKYLSEGGDPQVSTGRGYSLLMLAGYNDQPEVARLLLDAGANPDTADRGGNTVLMGAAFKGLTHIGRLLLDQGATIDRTNPGGQTALIYAALFGRTEFLELLLEYGADPDQSDASGNSAGNIAASGAAGRTFTGLKIFGKQLLGTT